MPPRTWPQRCEDILRCISKIEASIAGLDYDDFVGNDDKVDAVLYNLAIIGEAVNHLPN